MKQTKHTPGPWTACPPNHDAEPDETPQHYWAIRCPGQWPVISYELARISGHSDADETNARLIAAAPELLEVCQNMLEAAPYVSDYDVPIGLWDDLRAAIVKATGDTE